MVQSSDLLRDKSLHGLILTCFVTSTFISMTLDGFLASKTFEIYINACITVKVIGGISVHVTSEGYIGFLSFLVC